MRTIVRAGLHRIAVLTLTIDRNERTIHHTSTNCPRSDSDVSVHNLPSGATARLIALIIPDRVRSPAFATIAAT